MQEYIFDRYRQRYRLEVLENSEQSLYIKLKDGDEYAGQMLCSLYPPDTIILEDLFICNDLYTIESWGPRGELDQHLENSVDFTNPTGLRQKRKTSKSGQNYRQRGLGSGLLKLLIDYAKEKGVNKILGSVIKHDVEQTPSLIRWYLNRRFVITGPFEHCIENAQTYIRFDVQ